MNLTQDEQNITTIRECGELFDRCHSQYRRYFICRALKNVCVCFNVKNRVYAHIYKLNGFLGEIGVFYCTNSIFSGQKEIQRTNGMEIETGEGQLQIHLVTKQLQ